MKNQFVDQPPIEHAAQDKLTASMLAIVLLAVSYPTMVKCQYPIGQATLLKFAGHDDDADCNKQLISSLPFCNSGRMPEMVQNSNKLLIPKLLFLSICVLPLVCGCTTLKPNADPTTTASDVVPAGKYVVRIESTIGGEPTLFTGQIDKPMTVQDALAASKANKKYRDMDVTLIRKVDGNYRPLRMVCDYDPGAKAIKIEQNYAIHPGDRILDHFLVTVLQ